MSSGMNTLIKGVSLRRGNPIAQLTHSLFKVLSSLSIEVQIATQHRLWGSFLIGNLMQ